MKNKKIIITIGIIIFIIVLIIIWFSIPYSPLKNQFKKDISELTLKNQMYEIKEIFEMSDFEDMPVVIQKYIENSGFIGKEKMSYLKMEYKDVDFMQEKKGPKLKIDYTQYNFAKNPSRIALIESSMFGIPFEGYDYYMNNNGGMKGNIAKIITLFNQTGDDMDKACLVTFLAESMFLPSVLLQDYIEFEEIGDLQVKATITYKGLTASGVFTFNDKFEMISFTTNDRAVANSDGTMEYIQWTAMCSEYKINDNGINYPTKFKAIWNYPNEDFVYFDGIISNVSYQ